MKSRTSQSSMCASTRRCRWASGGPSAVRTTASRSRASWTSSAHAAKKDPLEFRLGLLKNHPRARKVLEVAAEKAGWGKPPREGPGARHRLSPVLRKLCGRSGGSFGRQKERRDQGAQGHLRRGLRLDGEPRHRVGADDGRAHHGSLCGAQGKDRDRKRRASSPRTSATTNSCA